MNGLKIKNSVSSLGIPKKPKIGAVSFEISLERPLACNNSTIENIATRYGNVLMQRSTAFLAPVTKQS